MADLRVLLCDDDPDMLGLLTRRLEKMGLEYDVAEDGRKAKTLLDEKPFDVIVTDIYMPEATGLEVLQHAKQVDHDLQVVIITSAATLDNAIDALNHGAFGYLTKPFDHLIVFDNMVTRAVEHRHLLVANKHKAEAQKRRGDMLEDEVAERVQQLQKKQKGLLDLLGSLPDGILVVEEGGKVVLSSPLGERWLARDGKSDHQPIHAFLAQVNSANAERSASVRLDERTLQLIAVDFPADGSLRRKAVIVRERETGMLGAGSLVTDTVLGIKKGLAALYKQGIGTQAIMDLANQFAVLEQLAGWTPSASGSPPGPMREPLADAPNRATGPYEPEPAAELSGPRLSTGELAEALRAAAGAEPESTTSEPFEASASVETLAIEEREPEVVPFEASAGDEPPVPVGASLDEHGFPAQGNELAGSSSEELAAEPLEDLFSAAVTGAEEQSSSVEPAAAVEPEPAEAQPEEVEPTLRKLDTGIFRPRIIPEAMNAKLGEPTPIRPSNGKRGTLRIGSSAANTQVFRRVLEKMSGETVVGPGEPEPEARAVPTEPGAPKREPDAAGSQVGEPAEDPVAALRRSVREPEPVREAVVESRLAPKASRAQAKKPAPPPAKKPSKKSWPPTLPSSDPDWDDSLETGG
jgi:DNA-binding response OmpR family regulator